MENGEDGYISEDGSVDIDIAARELAAALHGCSSGHQSDKSSCACDFCNRRGHVESTCFLNPDNPNNKLSSKMKERMMVTDDSKQKLSVGPSEGKRKGSGKNWNWLVWSYVLN